MSRHLTRLGIAGVFLSAGVLLAACSSDPAPTSPSGSPSESGSGTAVSGVPIRLGFSAWPGWFPWQVAEEEGLFAANGLDVELTYFESYTDSLTALATGNLDANSQTLNDTLASISGGASQTIVLVNDNSTGNDQIIADENITSVADLKGKTVAAEASTVDHYLLLLALKEAGLTEADVTFQPLLTDQAAAAFVAGQVDAVGVFAPFTTTALERPGSKAIATSADFPGAIPDHLVFDAAFVDAHPDEVQKLVDTWFDTLDWIAANRDEAVKIMAEKASVTVEEYESYEAGTTIFDVQDNIEAFTPGTTSANLDYQAEQIAQFLVDSGLTKDKPSLEGLLDDTFVKAVTPASASASAG